MTQNSKKLLYILYSLLIAIDVTFFVLTKVHYKYLFLCLAISIFTFLFHFTIRFSIANYVFRAIQKYCKPESWWFRMKFFEKKIYKVLKVKYWKLFLPTWNDNDFLINKNNIPIVLTHMCEAEVYHEICIFLSFIPILFSLIWGKFWVFFITSILGAIFDLLFVLIQRYNRPRLLKLSKRKL